MEQHEGAQRDAVNHQPNPKPDLQASHAGATIPYAGAAPPGEETPLTVRQWFAQNGFTLAVVVAVAALILTYFNPEQITWIAKAAIGLSLVIFIHELGHFLVAKWCDVHVTVFSIGFGPALPGCSFRRGETTYKLALLPLGGYVQMVGQVDGDEASDGSEDDPRSYRRKSVAKRMAIISAGVIMNVILAVFCFVAVFEGPGKERKAAVVTYVDAGAPAFKKGLRMGDAIEQIGWIEHPYFEDLMRVVMASGHGEEVAIVAKRLNGDALRSTIVPRKSDDDLRPMIGIVPSSRLQLRTKRWLPANYTMPTAPYSEASQAKEPFAFGDRIIATSDPDRGGDVTELPEDPRFAGQRDYFAFFKRMQRLAGKEVVIRVERTKDDKTATVDIRVPPTYRYSLGVRMQMGQITAVRDDSPAAEKKIKARDEAKNILKGDVIEKVSFKDKAGKTITYDEKTLDPLRLPDQLRAVLFEAEKRDVTLTLRRPRSVAGEETMLVDVTLPWDVDWAFDRALALNPSSPWAIPELGLAYQVKTIVAEVTDKDSPLQPWDEIKEIQLTRKDADGKDVKDSWFKLESDENWANVYDDFSGTFFIKSVKLKVARNKEVKELELVPSKDKTWPVPERGWLLMQDVRRQKADNFVEAVTFGFRDTHNSMVQVFETLKGMVTGRLSLRNLGGPLTIANVAYRYAGIDFWEFVFFLGLISVNLAVINFLPIPVLDGGHMVFLIYEGIRGKPASEGVRAGATYAGLALILCLMIFVLYLDISRLFL